MRLSRNLMVRSPAKPGVSNHGRLRDCGRRILRDAALRAAPQDEAEREGERGASVYRIRSRMLT